MTTEPTETLADRRAELRRDLLRFTGRANAVDKPLTPEEIDAGFDELAVRLVRYQADALPAYGALVSALDASLDDWRTAPVVPTALFAEMDLCSLPPAPGQRIFRTSGTTSKGVARGFRRVPDLALYDLGMSGPFVRHMLAGHTDKVRWLSLVPPASLQPESSLAHMVSGLAESLAAEVIHAFDADGLDLATAEEALSEGLGLGDAPVIVLATAFSLADLLERTERRFRLPRGSRVMVTGGFKGKRKAVDAREMFDLIKRVLGIPPEAVVDEYGMTELSSQAWGRPLEPAPTLRFRIIDPESGETLPAGRKGLVACFDLLNLDNVSAILTSDLGVLDDFGRLTLHGRLPGAVPRGCSLAAEEILARTGR